MQRQLKNYAQPYHKFVEAYEGSSLEVLEKSFKDNKEIFAKVIFVYEACTRSMFSDTFIVVPPFIGR
jgi:hypothetical protein